VAGPVLVDGAWIWTDDLAVDTDGAPSSYVPAGSGLAALSALANAGSDAHGWWGIVPGPAGKLEGAPLNAVGGYVSTTALIDSSYPRESQSRYVDASSVPYAAIGGDVLRGWGARVGDLGVAIVIKSGRSTSFVVADIAPAGEHHELSLQATSNLDGLAFNASGHAVSKLGAGSVAYILFPRSGSGWPAPGFEAAAVALLNQWGGAGKLASGLGVSISGYVDQGGTDAGPYQPDTGDGTDYSDTPPDATSGPGCALVALVALASATVFCVAAGLL
jgi:hypothetical protein